VLRETAQTLDEDKEALADLTRHRYASTNNLWFDLRAVRDELDRRDGILGLALIRNTKTVDPADPSSPEVIQIESAMGAAVEVFEDAALVEVTRARFLPVKTTNDLLVLRSDCYRLEESHHLVLDGEVDAVPFVDLAGAHYKLVGDFDAHFPEGVPSLRSAEELVVEGDWVFGADVTVTGRAHLGAEGGRVESGSTVAG
jgi:UTP--glucose-1-phosphate uridylyltransferase